MLVVIHVSCVYLRCNETDILGDNVTPFGFDGAIRGDGGAERKTATQIRFIYLVIQTEFF